MDKNRVLVADEDTQTRDALRSTLEGAGCECVTALNADQVLAQLYEQPFDLAFLNSQLPDNGSVGLLKELRDSYPDVVIITLAPQEMHSTAICSIREGAYDFLLKPFRPEEVLVVLNRAIERKRLGAANREYEKYLEQVAEDRAVETRRLFYSTIQVLVRLLELKIPFSAGHAARVAEMSRYVARELKMTVDGVRKVYLAALLHDVGLFASTDVLLGKEGQLTPDEFRQLRARASAAEDVLKPILTDEEVLKYIRHHHERYDGTGYPDGLKGNIIPLGARIIAVVEAFESMTHDRPYRDAYAAKDALAELARCSETQFDPQVVTVFEELYEHVFRKLDKPATWMP